MKNKTLILILKISLIVFITSCEEFTEPENFNYSWEKQESNTEQNLTDITFADSTNAWICGENGTILQSTDSGLSWIIRDFPTDINLKKIKFTDPNNGFILGKYEAYKTTDGGSTWISIFKKGDDLDVVDMQFLDSQTGWICSRDIYKTKDGGNNWEIITPVIDSTSIVIIDRAYFVTEMKGFASGSILDTSGSFLAVHNINIMTTNGGNSWEFKSNMNNSMFSLFDQMIFISQEVGFYINPWNSVFRTSNSGTDWIDIQPGIQSTWHNSGNTIGYRTTKLIKIDSLNIIITGNNIAYTGKYVGYISVSADAGKTWKPYQTGMYGKINSGYFKDTETGWIVGDEGLIFKTNKGGRYYYE